MTNARQRRIFLDKLRVIDVLLSGEDIIKEGVANAFHMVLSKVGKWRPNIDGLVFDSLASDDSQALEIPFSEEEVFATLSCLSGDKAFGPDDVSLGFWQFCWDFVKQEVMGVLEKFHELKTFKRSLNATFPVLVLQKI